MLSETACPDKSGKSRFVGKTLIIRIVLALSILLFSSVISGQQEKVTEKYSKVKISILDKSDLIEFQKAGFSLEGMKSEGKSVELILNEREIRQLENLGFSYEILIYDITKYYQERNRRTDTEMKNLEREMKEKYSSGGFGFGSMGGYYTFDEVVAELDSMRMLYPDMITAKDSIGSTLEGRTIWGVKISDNPDISEGEPEIFYNALIHAREPAGMMSVIYFMYYLLENYGSDSEITYLVDNRELYFVPVINPDGYEYNKQIAPNGGGMWRKNRIDNGNGCYGVDLNRNFGYMWGYNNIGSSPDPCSNLYRGTGPFSEFETQVIRDYCNDHNFIICNNYHSWWNVIFTPWEYVLVQTPDSTIFNHTIYLGTQFNGYGNGWYDPDIYELNGGASDWMYGEQTTKPKIFVYLTEVGNENDGFWPPSERIFPIAEENVYLNKVLAWGPGVIDNPPHIYDATLHPDSYIPFGDSISVSAVESNPENYNSIVTAYMVDIDDNIVDEFQLSKLDTVNYSGSHIVPQSESIYRILLQDSGTGIPSNFYYNINSKFTTAGPIVIDSISVTQLPNSYRVKPFVKNEGQSFTVEDLLIRMSSEDSSITHITGSVSMASIEPGEVVEPTGSFYVNVDSSFSGVFNFNFEIQSAGWTYWYDSKSATVTCVEYEHSLPISYNLFQNYPNPFNPTTTIRYQIPEQGFVMLKVYDVLGNEITSLVNEEKTAGNYQIDFDASSLSSGIYFYQLKVADPESGSPKGQEGLGFLETKKMIILR